MVYLTSFTVFFWRKKKSLFLEKNTHKKSSENEKKSSENDQLTGHFQSLFIYFRPPTLNLKKKSRKSTFKKKSGLTNPIYIILWGNLAVSSADNVCKQAEPRAGLTKCWAWSASKLFDTQAVFLKEFFEKVNSENKPCKFTYLPSMNKYTQAWKKYLNIYGFPEKLLKIKYALKSIGKSLWDFEKSLNFTIFCRT